VNGRHAPGAAVWLVVAVVSLPFLRGLAAGNSFYFRDLARQFFPVRSFVVEGLRQGQVRWWDPYTHEGTPVATAPVAYLPDLLHVLAPGEWFFSLLLALHVPLAAAGFCALAGALGLGRPAAAGGAIAYALGGFGLSSLSLYVHLQALAWTPFVLLGLFRAAHFGARGVAIGAVVVAVAASTTALEIVAQSVLVGAALVPSGAGPRRLARLGAALLLGAGLAAAALVPTLSQLEGSARSAGFPIETVLAFSIHPLSLVQALIGNWHFDLNDPMGRFWGDQLLGGYPYLLSLYLGAPLLALAAAGAALGGRRTLVLGALGLAGLLVSLGPAAGLSSVVEAAPLLRMFRFPCKAYFTVHVVATLLAALGLNALQRGRRRAWIAAALCALSLGGALTAAAALTRLSPTLANRLGDTLFPAGWSGAARAAPLDAILEDATRGGGIAAVLGLLAVLALGGRVRPERAAWAAVVLVAADLLRTGAGLNPMVSPSFYAASPESTGAAEEIRSTGGRLFTCEPEFSPAFHRARLADGRAVDVWTMAAYQEALLPNFQLRLAVPTAFSLDQTGLVPANRVLEEPALACRALDHLLPRLRAAGVAWVLSVDALSHPELKLRQVLRPVRVAPLGLHLYALADPLPMYFVASAARPAASAAAAEQIAREPGFQAKGGVALEAHGAPMAGARGEVLEVRATPGRLEMAVLADRPSFAVVREAQAPGWSAWVDGLPQRVLRADGRYRAVAIPAGASRVTMRYRPPHLGVALVMSAFCGATIAVLWARARRGPTPGEPDARD